MTADDLNSNEGCRAPRLLHDIPDIIVCCSFREHAGEHDAQRLNAIGGDIVAGDMDRQSPNIADCGGYGVRGHDAVIIAEIDQRAVLADAGAHFDVVASVCDLVKDDLFEQIAVQFAICQFHFIISRNSSSVIIGTPSSLAFLFLEDPESISLLIR